MSLIARKPRLLKWTGTVLGVLMGILGLLVLIGMVLSPDYTEKTTPAGYPVNEMPYLELNPETKIWVSVWLPENLQPGERVPAVMETSRYGERWDPGWLYRVMMGYGLQPDPNLASAAEVMARGYAFVWVQSPGSGQSSGPRRAEYPPAEIDAMRLAMDWIVDQPWSNGRVGAKGGSYSGTTAEVAAAANHPALRAVYAVAPDFDPFTVIRPGGLGSSEFVETWVRMIKAMDQDDMSSLFALSEGVDVLPFWKKIFYRSLFRGLRRPDGEDLEVFRQAMRDHRENEMLYTSLQEIEYKDQAMPGFDYTTEDIAMYNYREEIEAAAVNTYTRAGWLDAEVAKGVLQKYLTIPSPQKVVIGPTGHRLGNIVDLFDEEGRKPSFTDAPDDMVEGMLDYFDRYLKTGSDDREARRILYFTYGVNEWNLTATWPPEGMADETWYFSADHTLKREAPETNAGSDTYTVDFTANTGGQNRWMAQMGNEVRYGDRRAEDEKLLVYTSAPLSTDLEMTGSPTVWLYLSSDQEDGGFHVYLEDVAPDGHVTYLTEGSLRAVHRRVKDPSEAAFVPLGLYHTFREEDAEMMVRGEVTEIGVTLLPFSTVFRRGHAIRVAIAGHDAAMGDRCPPDGTPTITLERNSTSPTHITLPVRHRGQEAGSR